MNVLSLKSTKKMLCLSVCCYSFAFADSLSICSPHDKQADIKQSVKWYRNSAEKNALYHQAFGLGTKYVEEKVKRDKLKAGTWGVVLDIDETTLDNSWYFKECADLASDENDFSHYVSNPQKSVALPGVVKFTQLVHRLGGYVSLVSNRDGSFKDETGSVMDTTIANLKQQNIYFDQVLLANRSISKTPSDKNPRFNAIITGDYIESQMVWSNKIKPHKIIAYFGDNIQDFPVFKQKVMDKLDVNDATYNVFGNGFFILPNPMYGSWEANEYN